MLAYSQFRQIKSPAWLPIILSFVTSVEPHLGHVSLDATIMITFVNSNGSDSHNSFISTHARFDNGLIGCKKGIKT